MEQSGKIIQWKSIEKHAESIFLHIPSDIPQNTPVDKGEFNASACNIHLDYSHQRLAPDTLNLLIDLANGCNLQAQINNLIQGNTVNLSENKPALHTALRAASNTTITLNHKNIMPEIVATRQKMRAIIEQIRSKNWLGYSGKPITDIINIGIGGSDFGPRFCIKALSDFTSKEFKYHFISDADPSSFKRVVEHLSQETTLFIVASKSFTTQETIYNAKKAFDWMGDHPTQNHFIAVTAEQIKAHELGIQTVLPIWDWVGGRYSFCSAINLIAAIALGFDQFNELLAGANSMDEHFQKSDFRTNLPVLLGLLGIWNNNFLHINNLLILVYAEALEYFIPFIQQLDMESNGKSIDNKGKVVSYATGPLIWGGLGNQAQHSYYQLISQGTHKIAADFISLDAFSGQMINNMCANKIRVLTHGVHDENNPNGFIPGNTPLNHIRLNNYSPFTIGALVALYEHKVFVQSVIWDINPFDQPGVESAKHHPLCQEVVT